MRFGHVMLILFLLFIIGLLYEGHKSAKAHAACETDGIVLKDMNARYFCVLDGKIYPIRE